jgi:glucokinase
MIKTISVDMGATWIRAAVVDQDEGVQELLKTPTGSNRSPDVIVDDLVTLVRQLLKGEAKNISGIGIGVPTTFDEHGCLDPSPNIPTLAHYPFQDVLRRHFDLPLYFENDAQCFALGEWGYGVGKQAEVLAGLTIGTGIGLGIVNNGKLFRGAYGRAGEIWWAPVNIECFEDHPRYIELVVSGTGITDTYERQTGIRLKAEEIARQAEQQHTVARSVFDAFGTALRNVIFWIAGMLDPDIIVLGGSVVKSSDHFYDRVAAGLEAHKITLATSVLGELAPLHGAAMLVFSNH